MTTKNLIPTKNGYAITPYDHQYDAGLALMWNESDDQWPGTFTEGVPMTEDRVQRWMDDITTLQRFVGLAPDGKIVGYGDLWVDTARPHSAYVALLNVHPDHQGNSLARQMLMEMVDWSVQNQYDRITIGTWPSNLKAMPLYKKVGFFWQPDTNVYMENYVPTIRQLSQAQPYFAKHDWYKTYARELQQVEDELRHVSTGDTKVYILRWEAEQDFIEAVIDRYAQALTGFTTPAFSAHAFTDESEPAQGLRYKMRWQLANTSDAPMSVSLFASGDPGVKLDFRASLVLEPGETRTLTSSYVCEVKAPKYDHDNLNKPCPAVKSILVLNGEALEFRTGVRYQFPVKVTIENDGRSLMPGQMQMLAIQLKSHVKQPVQGSLVVMPQNGLTTDWLTRPFEIPSEGYWGKPIEVTCHNSGETPLLIKVRLKNDDTDIALPPKRFPLLAVEPGGFAAGTGDDLLILENDFFVIKCKPTGGEAKLWNKALREYSQTIKEELGPPYVPGELGSKTYHMQLKHENDAVSALMMTESDRFPGVTLTRMITITGSPVIKLGYQVTNDQDTDREFVIRTSLQNHQSENDVRVAPIADQPALWPGGLWTTEEDIPEKPERFKEQWLATQLNGQVAGVVWQGEMDKVGNNWNRYFLGRAKMTLTPQQTIHTPVTYLYNGPGEWTVVQALWQRLNPSTTRTQKLTPQPVSQSPHHFGISPNPVLTLSDEVNVRMQASNTRHFEYTGLLKATPPQGWTVDQDLFPFENLMVDTPVNEPVKLTALDHRVGAAIGEVIFDNQLFTDYAPFHVIRLGDKSKTVTVRPKPGDETTLWQIDNGSHLWEIAPAYGGGVVKWTEVGKDVNHLYTPYPKVGELSWFKPWYGGLHPTLTDPSKYDDWPGKLYREQFLAEQVEQTDSNGLNWQGVGLTSGLTRDNLEGLKVHLAYLTLPGSNVLKFTLQLHNTSPVYRDVEPGLMAYLQPDGSYEKTVLHGDDLHLKRSNQNTWINTGPWAAAENAATKRAIVMINPTDWQRTFVMDWGPDGGHMMGHVSTKLAPNSVYQLTLYLALAPSIDEAKRYALLKDVK